MTLEQILSIITNISIWSVAKVFILVGLLLYIVFTLMVRKQVALMSETLNGIITLPIKLIIRFQFFLAVIIFLIALIIL